MSFLPESLFTEQDLAALETLLASPAYHGDAMSATELQALFCAIASGPSVIPPSVWMSVALGEEPDYESLEQARAALDLVMRYYNSVVHALMRGELIEPIIYGETEEERAEAYAAWADAYMDGMDLSEPDWFEAVDSDEEADHLAEELFTLEILNGLVEEDARVRGEPWPEGEQAEELMEAAREDLPHAVLALHRFWLAKRGTATVRRDQPKVGRNDPCPCGSGRKFKHCCGKEPTVH